MPQKRNTQSSEPNAQTVGHNSPKRYSIWQNDNRKIWFALALLIAGLVLSCTAAFYVRREAESIARKEFDFAFGEIKNRILSRMQQHAQILRSGSAFFEINEDITREQWHNSIAHQNIEQVLPGIQGIGYAIIIPPDRLARHERKIRNEGFPQYAVKPPGKREIYTSIIYLEPFSERNMRAFGYDMFSEPIRRKAMEHARDFDKATLSGKIMLVQETDKDIQAGTLMFVPVYERGLPVRTIEERRRAIRGWVYSPYRMNDLMRGILGGWELGKGRQLRLEVFDNTSFQSESLMYDSGPGQKLEPTSATIFSEQTSILFNDHRWSLRFTQIGDQTGIVDYSKAWYVLIGGTLVSALLFALYLLLIIANYRKQAVSEALTRELRESSNRKLAEEALRESEKKYRWVLNNMADVIAVMDMNLRFTYVSPSIMRMRGYTAEEAVAQTFEQVMTPESLQISAKVFEEEMTLEASGTADPDRIRILEVEQYKKDGSIVLMENHLSFMRDEAKKPVGIISVSRDITARKQAEEALRENQRQLADIVKFLPDPTLAIDKEKHIIIWNKAIEEMTGIPAAEMIGKGDYAYTIPFYGEARPQIMDLVFLDNKEVKARYPDITREGDSLTAEVFCNALYNHKGAWVFTKASPLHDQFGNIIGAIQRIRDITDRKRMEEEREKILMWQQGVNQLQQSLLATATLEEKLRAITDSIVSIFDTDFCRIWLIQPGDLCEQGCVHAEVNEGPHICRYRDRCLHLLASSGRYTHTDGKIHRRVPFGCYKIGRVASDDDHKFLTNDVQNDPRVHNHEWARELGLVSFVGYQLSVTGGKTLGVLALFAKHPISFQEDAILDGLSSAVALVIQRGIAEKSLHQTLESLRKAIGTTIQVMVSAVEVRDPYTAGHQERSARLARAIATEMGWSQDKIDGIYMAGSIHDIGTLSVPAEILSKPTKLTGIEFSMIKGHSWRGFDMLKDVESPWPLAEIVHQHHERMDGSGYPKNLKGDEIIMEARILAVSDVVEAMSSHRPYRTALGIDAALEEISRNRGVLYDPKVADACLSLFKKKGFAFS